jgi:1-deoxy-D-xylulose-5-phosphate reductoisomerase
MKKKLAILGSTGSIGSILLSLINKKKFEIVILSANKDYKKILLQANLFNVKNIIINDQTSFLKAIDINKNKKIRIFNKNYDLKKIIKKKIDYTMSSITGIDGLKPTFEIIKFTKKIAIANKESLICAWPLINKELKKNNTEFVPVDSEHFSIWTDIKRNSHLNIDKIYLTASGGPLLNYDKKKINKANISSILNHPTWKMGKKISVDSATMMNKCFEVMEAKNIFNFKYNQIKILIHPDSYVHAIVVYRSGISKIITHDTTMKIPIFNSLYGNNKSYKINNEINIIKLNNLNFQNVDLKKFPMIKCLKILSNTHTLYDTIIVSTNDCIVNKFLEKKINFKDIPRLIFNFLDKRKYKKYKKIVVTSIDDIIDLNKLIKSDINQYFLKHYEK